MSKWSGFIVGLAIAITLVMTVVKPREAPSADALSERGAQPEPATVVSALFDDPTGYGRIVRDAYGNNGGDNYIWFLRGIERLYEITRR